jgi:hypothetical protein
MDFAVHAGKTPLAAEQPRKVEMGSTFSDILTPKIVQHHDEMADALRIKGTKE